MAKLWKVTAKSNNGKEKKGMSVEILDKNGNKPNQTAIAEALSNKYNEDVHYSHCGSTIFEFNEVKYENKFTKYRKFTFANFNYYQ